MLLYVSSKGPVYAVTRALAREVGRAGARVNTVSPGPTVSDGVREAGNLQVPSDEDRLTRALPREQTR